MKHEHKVLIIVILIITLLTILALNIPEPQDNISRLILNESLLQ